jgi:CelD/BcsL family acetyltransferase involved in cellulose biosynthesis
MTSAKVIALRCESSLARFEDVWRDLETRAGPHSMAATYEFALVAFRQAQKRSIRSFLIVLEDGGELSGIWGLTLSKRSLHWVLEPFSAGSHEEFSSPLLQAGGTADTAERMLRAAVSIKADRLLCYYLPVGGVVDLACASLGLCNRPDKTDGYVVSHAKYPSWPAVEAALSKGDRTELRRYVRRLQEIDPTRAVTVGWCATPEESDRAIDFFMNAKRRWLRANRGRSHWLEDDHVPDFFKALSRNTPVVATVRLGEEIIACALCLVNASSVEYAFTTYDEAYAKFGPGKLILKYLIEWSVTSGRDFNFGVTVPAYKAEWPVDRYAYVTRSIPLTHVGRILSNKVTREVWRSARRLAIAVRDRLPKTLIPMPARPRTRSGVPDRRLRAGKGEDAGGPAGPG